MSDSKDSKVNIMPLGLRVLLKPEEPEERMKGGLYVPPTNKEQGGSNIGIVVTLGDGIDATGKKRDFKVKKGDKVIYKKYSGEEVELDDEKYVIINETDIVAVVK